MALLLPPGDFKAYLFDCDGTVVDSMPLHLIAWQRALGELGCRFTTEQFYGWGGLPAVTVIETLNREQGLHMAPALVSEHKGEYYYELLPQLKPIPDVVAYLREARAAAIPTAIVSGSTRESVLASLDAVGLTDQFDTLVCAGDYRLGKPSPEPFVMAAERLGVAPTACLVFEDADPGIEGAKAAGMGWVKVPPPWER